MLKIPRETFWNRDHVLLFDLIFSGSWSDGILVQISLFLKTIDEYQKTLNLTLIVTYIVTKAGIETTTWFKHSITVIVLL